MDNRRRILIHGSTGKDHLTSGSFARSLINDSYQGRQVHVKSRLLRVSSGVYSKPRDTIFQHVNLRFLAQEHSNRFIESPVPYLPSSISLLWNVQTLIITGAEGLADRVVAPSGIWKMTQLRHVMCRCLILPELPPGNDGIVLHNLQTLWEVVNCRFIGQVFDIMPKIKKLRVWFNYFPKGSANFASFSKLESLHFEVYCMMNAVNLLDGDILSQHLKFPNSLKKLTLVNAPLGGKDISVISSLPNLEVLKLVDTFTNDFNWDSIEGKFLRLRYLQIFGPGMNCWNADDTHFPVLENLILHGLVELNEIPKHFPVLENLIIHGLIELKEIPLGIGEIQTLERISLTYCSHSSALSALKILEEQQNFGNKGLHVKVRLGEFQAKEFMQLVEAEGLTGLDFQLDVDRWD